MAEFLLEFAAAFIIKKVGLPRGGEISKLTVELKDLFSETKSIPSNVVFIPVAGNTNNNEIRKNILKLCTNKNRAGTAADLAKILLQHVRSGRGLRPKEVLFLTLVGRVGSKVRIILILTRGKAKTISLKSEKGENKLEFSEGFYKDYLKTGGFEDNPKLKNSFRQGKVSDNQVDPKNKIASEYWISFLQVKPELTSTYATATLTKCFKNALDNATPTQAAGIIQSIDKLNSERKKVKIQETFEKIIPLELRAHAQKIINKRLTDEQKETAISLDLSEIYNKIEIKKIILDDGISIMGPREKVENKVKIAKDDGENTLTIHSKILEFKFQRRRGNK